MCNSEMKTKEKQTQQTMLYTPIQKERFTNTARPPEQPTMQQKAATAISARENRFLFKKLEKSKEPEPQPMQDAPQQVKTRIARLDNRAHLKHFVEERKQAFHEQLALNCNMDMELATNESCKTALAAIQNYIKIPLDAAHPMTHGDILTNIRKQIEKSLAALTKALNRQKNSKSQNVMSQAYHLLQQDIDILKRYQLYFQIFQDGNLEIPENLPQNAQIDATKNFSLHNPALTWKKMHNQPLFPHEPSINDIQQGFVGDCYLQAALVNLITMQPEKIKECIRDNGNGNVTVRFYRDGQPLYVTVAKEIATKKGEPYFARGAMWVHMIQKAYAASGLHNRENNKFEKEMEKRAIEKLGEKYAQNNLSEKEKQTLEAEKQKFIQQYKQSYERIEGGLSNIFLQALTNEVPKTVKTTNVTATDFSDLENSFLNEELMAAALNPDPILQTNLQIKVFAYTHLLDCFKDELQKGLPVFQNQNGQQEIYSNTPLSIEDLEEKARTFSEWGKTTTKYAKFQQGLANLLQMNLDDADFEAEMEQFVQETMQYFLHRAEEGICGYHLQHRMFTTKKDEATGKDVGVYTPYALAQYQKIEQALKAHQPVGAGTQRLTPKEVSESGLNNEALKDGLVETHAYSIVGCQEMDGYKYVQLRNPWGNFVRGYQKVTTPGNPGEPSKVEYKVKQIDKKANRQQGQFLIELNDFMSHINKIYGISD